MRILFKMFLLSTIFMGLMTSISAQKTPTSAEEEFEEYRNIKQTTLPSNNGGGRKPNNGGIRRRKNGGGKSDKTKKHSKIKNVATKTKNNQTSNVGLPGMKIWLERQIGGEDKFLQVVPTNIFRSGDWVRVKFQLNFEGFLTIINLGTSGKTETIFPLENQSNKIAPKTNYSIPDDEGWQFDDNEGKEELIFIVSRKPLTEKAVQEFKATKDFESQAEVSVQTTDRDLIKPKTENKSVYVLASDARLEKPLVFRLTLKHR